MPAAFKVAMPLRDRFAAHPTGQHRLAVNFCMSLETLGYLVGVRHSLRRKDDQQSVAIRIFRGNVHRLRIALRIGVAQNVDGISVAPVRAEEAG